MLLPYSTDAPLYHWPAATVGLIVANLVLFLVVAPLAVPSVPPIGINSASPLGYHPGDYLDDFLGEIERSDRSAPRGQLARTDDAATFPRWLAANFRYRGWMHRIVNLLGLWTFGLIVEGRIGWRGMLPLYLGIGTVTAALAQCATPDVPQGAAAGAAGAVAGLIAVALVWSPANHVRCVYPRLPWFWRHVEVEDAGIPVWVFALVYLGLQLLLALFAAGPWLSGELIQLAGAVLGAAAAVGMLRRGWVDCERWDVFSLLAGKHSEQGDEQQPAVRAADRPPSTGEATRRRRAQRSFAQRMDQGRWEKALALHLRQIESNPRWRPPAVKVRMLIHRLLHADRRGEAQAVLRDYIARYPAQSGVMRLRLAQLLLERERQPAAAEEVLAATPAELLTPAQEQVRQQLARRAAMLLASAPQKYRQEPR